MERSHDNNTTQKTDMRDIKKARFLSLLSAHGQTVHTDIAKRNGKGFG